MKIKLNGQGASDCKGSGIGCFFFYLIPISVPTKWTMLMSSSLSLYSGFGFAASIFYFSVFFFSSQFLPLLAILGVLVATEIQVDTTKYFHPLSKIKSQFIWTACSHVCLSPHHVTNLPSKLFLSRVDMMALWWSLLVNFSTLAAGIWINLYLPPFLFQLFVKVRSNFWA